MKPRAVGLDVGGTKILGVSMLMDATEMQEVRVHTSQDLDRLIEKMRSITKKLDSPPTIGIGVPGPVDLKGLVVAAPNLPCLAGLTAADLSVELGRNVVIDNDAKCATLAESRFGAGAGASTFILLAVGTGLGGAVVTGTDILRGGTGFAGEIGHMIVDPTGPECPCGQRGCWEQVASGAALSRAAKEGFREGWLLPASDDEPRVRGEDLIAAARADNWRAVATVDRYSQWLAVGLVNLINIFDPERVVISGGIVGAADVVFPAAETWLDRLWNGFGRRKPPQLLPARLGERAGAIGAALLGSGA